MLNTPIIRVEIEGIRQQLVHAFHQSLLDLDAQFKLAVDRALDPERIQQILDEEARRTLDLILAQETRRFFTNGPGLAAVRATVNERLDEMFSDTGK
jgi:hypothetical protein